MEAVIIVEHGKWDEWSGLDSRFLEDHIPKAGQSRRTRMDTNRSDVKSAASESRHFPSAEGAKR